MIPSLRISLEQNLMPGTQVCGSVPEGVGVKHTQDDTYYERTERCYQQHPWSILFLASDAMSL